MQELYWVIYNYYIIRRAKNRLLLKLLKFLQPKKQWNN